MYTHIMNRKKHHSNSYVPICREKTSHRPNCTRKPPSNLCTQQNYSIYAFNYSHVHKHFNANAFFYIRHKHAHKHSHHWVRTWQSESCESGWTDTRYLNESRELSWSSSWLPSWPPHTRSGCSQEVGTELSTVQGTNQITKHRFALNQSVSAKFY